MPSLLVTVRRGLTAITERLTGTRASAPRAAPGSGSISPRLSAKARQLLRENQRLRVELARETKAHKQTQSTLRSIAGGRITRDPMARTMTLCLDVGDEESVRYPEQVVSLALETLMLQLEHKGYHIGREVYERAKLAPHNFRHFTQAPIIEILGWDEHRLRHALSEINNTSPRLHGPLHDLFETLGAALDHLLAKKHRL